MEIKNLIAFCILMENDKGILNKSQEYVMEKFERLIIQEMENPEAILDPLNKRKLEEWIAKWGRK